MSLYTDKVMDHFEHPRNVGVIEDADGVGEVGNPVCGDIMKMYLKVEDDKIVDVKFKTFGCGSAIATSSMATELIKGLAFYEFCSHGTCSNSTSAAESLELDICNLIVFYLEIHLHDVSADRVSDFSYSVSILINADIVRMLEMIHYFICI